MRSEESAQQTQFGVAVLVVTGGERQGQCGKDSNYAQVFKAAKNCEI